MGRPPSNGGPAFRFTQPEVVEMEAILNEHNNAMPARDVLTALAEKFSESPDRKGKITVQMKQVWNWFQNKRYAIRAKSSKTPGKLNITPMPRVDMAPVRNMPQPTAAPIPAPSASVPTAAKITPENSVMEFEAKSGRDGAWYDVANFLSYRHLETSDPEVLVRFSGFGPEEDEWVNVRKNVRPRSLPCESSECVAVLPGDLILCFQEGKEQALYFDAHVLDAQRRRHDVRGCRCRFLVRYDHDQSEEVFDVDGDGSDQSFHDDYDCSDFFSDEYMHVDDYTLLQSHFDNANIPPGIEAPIPWLAEHDLGSKKAESSSLNPFFHTQQSDSTQINYLSQPTWLITNPETQGPSAGVSSLETKMDAIDHPSKIKFSSQLFSQTVPMKKRNGGSHFRSHKTKKLATGESSKSNWFLGPSDIKKPNGIGYLDNHGFFDNSKAMMLTHGGESPHWKLLESAQKEAGSMGTYHPNFIGPVNGPLPFPGTEFANPWLNSFHPIPFSNYGAPSSFFNPFVSLHTPPEQMYDNFWVHNPARDGNHGTTADSTVVTISDEARAEILKKFQNFKQFDTIDDTSDHYFVRSNSSMQQHSKSWGKKIQEEWKLLEKDLPDSIFVRVYESRIDLLRAVIIGAEGTPYHDGLFFFDVFFPSGYPNVPPQVHYHSCGLRLNPNLYNCGKVCLSLLNTWSGSKNEKWLPGVSTILQVLVSIQGLILNTKPYFNEPGYARLSGSLNGEMKSLRYNEDTFLLSLRTMVYLIRRPPKHFEDFVIGHFCSRAHDILVAVKAYMDGAQVGCLVKGGVQDLDQGDKSCSKEFKNSLPPYVDMLVKDFANIGAKDCEKFLSSSTTRN